MTTNLEDDLRSVGSDLRLDLPLDEVLSAGNRRRQRRQRVIAVGVVAAAVTGGFAGLRTVLPSYDPVFPHADAMAWGPQLVDLPAKELAAADRVCKQAERSQIPTTAKPVAAGSRDGHVVLVYRAGKDGGDCTLEKAGRHLQERGLSWGKWDPPKSGFSFMSLDFSQPGVLDETPGAVLEDIVGGGLVADDVARLYVEVADQRLQATIENGVAMYWLPDRITRGELDAATVAAYDADGELVEREPLMGAPDSAQAPNDDRDR